MRWSAASGWSRDGDASLVAGARDVCGAEVIGRRDADYRRSRSRQNRTTGDRSPDERTA
jgi:hypothetical protein